MARWNPLENNLRVYKVVEGSRTLRIVAYGRNIRGYLDDQLCVEAEDDQFIQPGLIGMWTKSDAVTEFDDFHGAAAFVDDVKELPVPTRD